MKTLGQQRVDPLKEFQKTLVDFAARKRRGIRNPFVIVPVAPPHERRLTSVLSAWEPDPAESGSDIPVTRICLDEVMPKTKVYQTVVSIPQAALDSADPGDNSLAQKTYGAEDPVTATLQDNLATEIVDCIINEHPDISTVERQILLLLNLGSLFPFARASELLDEFERRRTQSTIGIPFPGTVIGGKLAFFGEDAHHYYPAHRIDQQVKGEHLQ